MLEKNLFLKPIEFGQWLCRKPSAGLLIWAVPSGMQYAAAAAASTMRQAQAAAIGVARILSGGCTFSQKS